MNIFLFLLSLLIFLFYSDYYSNPKKGGILHYQCDDGSEGINSGENLCAISFTKNNLDIEIGMEGDVEGINYLKIKNGCCLVISSACQQSHLKINIAWKYKEDDFDVSVWFAVDPTINT